MKTTIISVAIFLVSAVFGADVRTLMLERTVLAADDSFAKDIDTNRWSPVIGSWRTDKGVLIGTEREDDHHAAVIKTPFTNVTAVIQFNFMLKGDASFSFSINDASGHNSRVQISALDVVMRKDVDKKDPKSFGAVLDDCGSTLKPDVWHTMTIELRRDEMFARIDDNIFLVGAHPGIDREKKDFGFPVNGEVWFDDVKVWNAKDNPAWAAEKQKLIARQSARPAADYSKSPQTAYSITEAKLRARLMKNDDKFKALVDVRAAAAEALAKKYPVINRKGDKAAAEIKRLAKEDEVYKKMTADLRKAQADERNYELAQDPKLKALADAMVAANKAKAAPAKASSGKQD